MVVFFVRVVYNKIDIAYCGVRNPVMNVTFITG